ncbi:hypothetical protein [Aureibaculum marinum]|nr:hypothetical protein [Aureibaculum marinum]
MKTINFILLLLFSTFVTAQQYVMGTLSNVNNDGLYEIRIPNEIRSFSNRNLSNFRIVDDSDNEIPYFIRHKDETITINKFEKFEIITKQIVKDSISVYVIKSPYKTLNQLVLEIANYNGSKNYKLLGSNNQKEWFGIVNSSSLSELQHPNKTSIFKRISFPKCTYSYLKIIFNNTNSLPINILNIGNSKNSYRNEPLQEVKYTSKVITEISDKKITKVHFDFKNKEIINQVFFKITKPELYNRRAKIYKIDTREVKGKKENYKQYITQFYLNSNSTNSFKIPELHENNVYIEIENKDNSPLTIKDVLFYQNPLYIVVPLKANKTYTVKTGIKSLKAPQYDLSFFKNEISNTLPRVDIEHIEIKNMPTTPSKIATDFWKKPWFMWLCIAIAGIVIFYFTISLVKDLRKDN